MTFTTANRYFFVCGSSEGESQRNALDGAFLRAGIGNVNRLAISAIIPPGCAFVEPCPLPAGALVPSAGATVASALPGEIISAGVAAALPRAADQPGVVMEYAARGHKEEIEAIVRRLAREALAQRGLELGEIRSLAVQHKVEKIGAAIAAVVLWE